MNHFSAKFLCSYYHLTVTVLFLFFESVGFKRHNQIWPLQYGDCLVWGAINTHSHSLAFYHIFFESGEIIPSSISGTVNYLKRRSGKNFLSHLHLHTGKRNYHAAAGVVSHLHGNDVNIMKMRY